jgi:hypothetical protein
MKTFLLMTGSPDANTSSSSKLFCSMSDSVVGCDKLIYVIVKER